MNHNVYRGCKGNSRTPFHQGGNTIMKANKPITPVSSMHNNEKEKRENNKNNNDSIISFLKTENMKFKEELHQKDKLIKEFQRKIHYLEKEINGYKNQIKVYQQRSSKSNSSNNVIRNIFDPFKSPYEDPEVFDNRHNIPDNILEMMMGQMNSGTNDELIDPVKEVEDHIISELCPNPDQMTYEQLLALEENVGSVSKGLSKAQVNQIPLVTFSKHNIYKNEDKCVVCQYEFKNYEKIRRLPCEHLFHRECVDEWLLKDRTCPCCKKEVN